MGRVIIVGGGIGGLAAAAALRRTGVDADVFEQAPQLREVGAGVGLWSNALASLDQIGAGDDIRRSSVALRTVAGARPDGRTLTCIKLDELGPEFADTACFVAQRRVLLAALRRQVLPERIHTGCHVDRAEALSDRVRVHLENGRVEEGDLLLGADGIHSVIRALVVGADTIRYSGQTCFRGIAPFSPPDPTVLREIQGRGQRGSVCPISAKAVYWWVAHNSPPDGILPPEKRKALLRERYRDWPFGLPQAIDATPDEEILQNDLIDRPPAKNYVRGRVVLSGDAAHPTTPNLGQGANMAIDDAISLARALRDEESVSAALARYESERVPRTRLIVQRSWSFGKMCRWDSALGVALREALVRMTPDRVMTDMLRWQILEGVGAL
jgi:2-polyprenyl-6-methoxyphenol hydroxylase-like FAD-dependent oxidoreductase